MSFLLHLLRTNDLFVDVGEMLVFTQYLPPEK
jgi:hypothetical protein